MMPYILHAGLILAACLVFYKLLLQRETFFRLNRWVLMVCLVLSFGLPLIEVPQQWSFRRAESPVATPVVAVDKDQPSSAPAVNTAPATTASPVIEPKGIDWPMVITWTFRIYWLGVIIFGINFLLQIVILLYRAYTRPVIKDGKFRIVELSGDNAPCSFANNIFINPEKYDWETYNQVLQHEKIHVQEGHTVDLLIAELVIIFQWFNPFAWSYRKTLENNLEFLTDAKLLHQQEVEKTSYQMSLLKVSAPHFPLSLTTNYNQSLLKKRVAMMNAKKSNVHTTWKYLFLFPVLVLSVCLLNQPIAKAQDNPDKNLTKKNRKHDGLPTEGYWFATIKNDKVNMQFKSDEDDASHNNTNFELGEFKNLPREGSGTFTVTRDAGTIEFTGKFEGNQGMGRYKFVADKNYYETMRKEGVDLEDDKNQFVYFMVDVSKDYVQMLKRNGYKDLDKDQLIPLAALKVDEAFINTFKKKGYPDAPLEQLIPLKALGVTGEYIDEIRDAGYKDVSLQQLVTFKAQNINGKYLADMRSVKLKASEDSKRNKNNKDNDNNDNKDNYKEDRRRDENPDNIDNIVAWKALDITPEYINSLKEAGYDNLSENELIPMKAQGITADYIRGLKAQGFEDLSAHDLIAMRSQNITMDYLKSFESVGYGKISVQKALPLKALHVTPDYIKSFQDLGYKNISIDNAVGMKAQGITPSLVREYNDLGFGQVPIDDIVAAKATGTTPAYIKGMKEKGHNLRSVQKYVSLKAVIED
jgi:hypothetical protein